MLSSNVLGRVIDLLVVQRTKQTEDDGSVLLVRITSITCYVGISRLTAGNFGMTTQIVAIKFMQKYQRS